MDVEDEAQLFQSLLISKTLWEESGRNSNNLPQRRTDCGKPCRQATEITGLGSFAFHLGILRGWVLFPKLVMFETPQSHWKPTVTSSSTLALMISSLGSGSP